MLWVLWHIMTSSSVSDILVTMIIIPDKRDYEHNTFTIFIREQIAHNRWWAYSFRIVCYSKIRIDVDQDILVISYNDVLTSLPKFWKYFIYDLSQVIARWLMPENYWEGTLKSSFFASNCTNIFRQSISISSVSRFILSPPFIILFFISFKMVYLEVFKNESNRISSS